MKIITNIKPLLILALAVLLCSNQNIAQNVGIGAESFTPDPSAMLEVKSTESGFLPPRMTTEQRDMISNPVEGLQIFNITTKCLNYRVGNSWFELCGDCISDCPCGTYDVTFIYNGQQVTYGTVESNGRCWLDRNLGALQVATSSTDHLSYGDLFQWGRAADGHQIITWTNSQIGSALNSITADLSLSDSPSNELFIVSDGNANISPFRDWRSDNNNDRWNAIPVVNNPCPNGWRVPTEAEMQAELESWVSNEQNGAYLSPLKFTVAGFRMHNDGTLNLVGQNGYYWTNTILTPTSTWSRRLSITSNSMIQSAGRASGYSIRCIKD